MTEIDCMYYDRNEDSCALLSSYYPTGRIVVKCKGNVCQDKKSRPLLYPPPQTGKYIKLSEPKFEVENELESGKYLEKFTIKVSAQIAEFKDKVVYDEIIKFAKEQGITDLFLLDKGFITNAINHEMQRQQKPKTNFDRITESVESFTEWAYKNYHNFTEAVPCLIDNCEAQYRSDCKKCFIEWLQKECEG